MVWGASRWGLLSLRQFTEIPPIHEMDILCEDIESEPSIEVRDAVAAVAEANKKVREVVYSTVGPGDAEGSEDEELTVCEDGSNRG